MKWVVFGGYHEEHLYVDELEEIVGWVYGSLFHKNKGWSAAIGCKGGSGRVGIYLTLDAAKAAVERAHEGRLKQKGGFQS